LLCDGHKLSPAKLSRAVLPKLHVVLSLPYTESKFT
jgi:hypothetical protein